VLVLATIAFATACAPAPSNPATGIDPRSVGARGDGTTDDTAALQRAIDLALAQPRPSVHLPAGTYLISAPLVYDDGLQIVGDGAGASTIRNTTTRSNGTAMLVPAHLGVHDARVQDLSFDQRADVYDRAGASKHEFLLDVGATTNMTVEGVGFHNVRTIAIYADTTQATPTVGLRVIGNHIFESNGGGISLFGSARDLAIDQNIVEHTKDDAIAVQDHGSGDYPTDVRITGNVVVDCTQRTDFGSTPNGILSFGADDVLVAGNSVSRVLSNGIRVGSGANRRGAQLHVLNNAVSGAGTGNNTSDVPAHGILVIGADHVQVAGNQVTQSKHQDYSIVDSTDVMGP